MTERSFTGRSALITGAASGIGAACARWLDAHGIARLVLVDRDQRGLDALEVECEAERHTGDVGDEAFWYRLRGTLGGLDHAVVNAGVASGTPLVQQDFEEWRRILSVNLDGAFLTLRASLAAMSGRGGSIVVLGSIAGRKALVGTSAYGSSKAAVAHLAQIAAAEHAPEGIRVNVIAPGGVDTPIWDKNAHFTGMVQKMGRAQALAQMAQGTPTGRFSTADEIAAHIGFLLSDDAANITGAVLASDGGLAL